MTMVQSTNRNVNSVVILGASFITGNLGVSALAWSAVNLLKHYWPDARIRILGARDIHEERIALDSVTVDIVTYPVRYCKNLLAQNHIWKLFMGIVLQRFAAVVFKRSSKKQIDIENISDRRRERTTLQAVLNADLICDITGGDSFSDIYGMGRFIKGYLLKRTCQLTGKPFVMLPQTYGPFKSQTSGWLAKRVLDHSALIFSRDKEGLKVIEDLIGPSDKARLCPDVAFTLQPHVPESESNLLKLRKAAIETLEDQRIAEDSQLIGLNVSGLLYFGGYTGKNEFGLKDDYVQLVKGIINYFCSSGNSKLLLVPHVVPLDGSGENDLQACRKLREELPEELRLRVFTIEADEGRPFFDQCEVKYFIGQCDMMLGSRMHATIAAISQCIPTVGLAYSKKFAGVYETVGIEDCVADLRKHTNDEIMSIIKTTHQNMAEIKERLEKTIPEVKERIYSIFQDL
jgi:colanic acid/amylovoran biosynthesis protein